MACKKCSRYVTTYQGKWRNLGTLSRQTCKPKAKRQAKRAGKAPQKQKGGGQPALPPGSLSKGRTKGPNKKRSFVEPAEQAALLVLSDLQNLVERKYGESLSDATPVVDVTSGEADELSPPSTLDATPQAPAIQVQSMGCAGAAASSSSAALTEDARRRQRPGYPDAAFHDDAIICLNCFPL
eukprot:2918463-Amphidinium_carterae.1